MTATLEANTMAGQVAQPQTTTTAQPATTTTATQQAPTIVQPQTTTQTDVGAVQTYDQTAQQAAVADQPVVPVATTTQATETTTPSTSVTENLAALTEEGGAYLTQAKQEGTATAARRGLQNTTLAGQASEAAAIQAALPIAQQEAETQLTAQTASANLQAQYATDAQNLLNQYAISINEIETAPDIATEDKNQMIQNEIDRRDADLAFLQSMYSALPAWQPDWATLDEFPDAPGVT